MTTIILGDLHDALVAAKAPILSVRRKVGVIELVFTDNATAEQKAAAQAVVDAYDQDAVDAAKPQPVTAADIADAKSVGDLKALLVKMLNEKN